MTDKEFEDIHDSCYLNKKYIDDCGGTCFNCGRYEYAHANRSWTDNGETALCPKCGLDTVIPGIVHADTIDEIREYWLGEKLEEKNNLNTITFDSIPVVDINDNYITVVEKIND